MNVAERPYYPLVSSVVVRAFRTPLTLVVAFALFFPSMNESSTHYFQLASLNFSDFQLVMSGRQGLL